jgi:SSS family solute:Na+ symporter
VFTARDGKVARRGGLFAGVYCLLYALAGAVIGMAARALLPDLSVPDNAFAAVTTATLPVGVTGLVLAAALAAVMSTASATMLAASTILANDVTSAPVGAEPADALGRQRLFTFGVGVVMIALSIAVQDVVGALTIAYNLLVGALLVPIVGGLFWARSTGKGALAAIATGGTVVIALMLTLGMFANEAIYWGLAASAVAFVVVSLSTTDARRADRVETPETSTA